MVVGRSMPAQHVQEKGDVFLLLGQEATAQDIHQDGCWENEGQAGSVKANSRWQYNKLCSC